MKRFVIILGLVVLGIIVRVQSDDQNGGPTTTEVPIKYIALETLVPNVPIFINGAIYGNGTLTLKANVPSVNISFNVYIQYGAAEEENTLKKTESVAVDDGRVGCGQKVLIQESLPGWFIVIHAIGLTIIFVCALCLYIVNKRFAKECDSFFQEDSKI